MRIFQWNFGVGSSDRLPAAAYKSTIFGLVDSGLRLALVVSVTGTVSWLPPLIMGSAVFVVSMTVVGTRHLPSK